MPFLKSENGQTFYPYNTREDYPNTGFPAGSDYPEFGIYWVHPTSPGNPNPLDFNVIESTPVFNPELSRWEQTWDYPEKSAEEKRIARYNPEAFLSAMLSNSDYLQWYAGIADIAIREHLAPAAADAKQSGVWTVFNGLLNQAIALNPLSPELRTQVNDAITAYGIPITLPAEI